MRLTSISPPQIGDPQICLLALCQQSGEEPPSASEATTPQPKETNAYRKILLGTLAAAAVAAPLALAASPANAATALTNASFEDATVSFTDGYSVVDAEHQTLTGWNAGGAGVDIVDDTLWNADEGSRSIDLNAFNPGSISQTIDTVPGQTYNVYLRHVRKPGRECRPRGPRQ